MSAYHPYGLALYKATSTRLLRPGAVGYFNRLGEWAPITQLDDPELLKKDGFKPPEEDLEQAKYKPITNWDRKCSEGVKESDVSGNASVCAAMQQRGAIGWLTRFNLQGDPKFARGCKPSL